MATATLVERAAGEGGSAKKENDRMITWVVLFHIVGLVFWVGGLLVATALLGQHAAEEFPEGRAALGQAELRMISGMANPGAGITIVTGVILAGPR
ncbi:MAG: hypothetical protein ACRD18_13385, partial [Terriglobia bacterium]